MSFHWMHSLSLFFAFTVTASANEAGAGDFQEMIRRADESFRRHFAQTFLQQALSEQPPPTQKADQGKTLPDISPEKQPASAIMGQPENSQRPATAASGPPDSPTEAMQKSKAGEPDQTAGSPASLPAEKNVFGKTANKARVQLAMERARQPHSAASALSPAGFTFRDCGSCPEMVVAPKGEFTMGSNWHPYEKPEHKVKIGYPFAIGRYQVTSAEWSRCADAGDCDKRPNPQRSDGDTAAAGDLSWDDASAYLKWLSRKTGHVYRLPSEAEWEYAVRTGLSKSNSFGPYDTAGKMAEWVQDCWHDSYRGAPADGSAWLSGNCSLRGLRGGQFASKARFSPASARFRYDSDVRYFENGFRVLRELR